jgi:AraC-like DNA-binding protein
MLTIAWIGFSQSLFAALLIGTKRDNSVSDKILSGWLSLLAIEFLTVIIDYRIFNKPLLSNSFLLFNPAFYLYVKSLTKRDFRLKWIHLLHLLPYTAFEISVYVIREPLSLDSFFGSSGNLIFRIFFVVVALFSWLVYNAGSAVMVDQHRKNLKNEFSSIDSRNRINWILFIVIMYTSSCIIVFGTGAYSVFTKTFSAFPHILTHCVLLLLIYILGYYGLMQKSIFLPLPEEEPVVRYKDSALSERKKKEIKTRILKYFEKEKPYLNPELNLDLLSRQTNLPKHHLTEVLNTEIGMNFFHFVNSYRVTAVTEMLLDPKNRYSIEAIGYDCGFNSKSSFFTVFKQLTGQTPAQYKQMHS